MNNYINYEQNMLINFNGLQPITIKGQNNLNTKYQKRYLYNKIYSCLDINFGKLKSFKKNKNSFRWLLFHCGSVCLFNDKKYGSIFGGWSPIKYNLYQNPAEWHFNPINSGAINDYHLIGNEKNSVIIKMFDDYLGFDDLVSDTAVKMAMLDKLIETASMNGNVNLVAYVSNKKQGETIKTAYATATQGEPLVILNRNIKDKLNNGEKLLEPFTSHDTILSVDRLLTARRTIVNNFLTEIGIKNANFQKKERLITDEVNSNNEEVSSNITIAYNNIREGFEEYNEMTGSDLSIDLHYDYEVENDIEVMGGGDDV